MIHIDEDLDFIFIRTQNPVSKKWGNVSLRDLTDDQWEKYLMDKFGEGKKFWKDDDFAKGQPWTDEQRLDLLNWLTKQGAVFVMIVRGEVRKNWNK